MHFVIETGVFETSTKTARDLNDVREVLHNAERAAQAGDEQAAVDAKWLAKIAERLSIRVALDRRLVLANWPYAVIPPLALFAIGWIVAWVLKGFQRVRT